MRTFFYTLLVAVLMVAANGFSARGTKPGTTCWSMRLVKQGQQDSSTVGVSGRMTDPWGQGVAWLRITMGSYSTVSDDRGYFSFGQVPAGKYMVQVGGYCSLQKKKAVFKRGQKIGMNIYIPKGEEHLPGLGIPGKK